MSIASLVNSICNSMSYRIGNCLIDPGDEWEGFHDLSTVLLTHGHFDHIYGLNRIIGLNPTVLVYTNEVGREMLLDSKKNLSFYHETPFVMSDQARIVTVEDGEEVKLGTTGLTAKAIFTPGHNPSCISWIVDDSILTGDSYIPGLKTVTNLPGGNKTQAIESLNLIKRISQNLKVLSGHKI